jgi:hypothetical protein
MARADDRQRARKLLVVFGLCIAGTASILMVGHLVLSRLFPSSEFNELLVRPLPEGFDVLDEDDTGPSGGGVERHITLWLVATPSSVDPSADVLIEHLESRGFTSEEAHRDEIWKGRFGGDDTVIIRTVDQFLSQPVYNPRFHARVESRRDAYPPDSEPRLLVLLLGAPDAL